MGGRAGVRAGADFIGLKADFIGSKNDLNREGVFARRAEL